MAFVCESAECRTVRSGPFSISFSGDVNQRDVSLLVSALKEARTNMVKFFGRQFNGRVDVMMYSSTKEYCDETGMPWWKGAAWVGGALHFQPPAVLEKKGLLGSTARHEYSHIAVRDVAGGSVPAWLEEGFATLASGEFDNAFKADKKSFFWDVPLSKIDATLNKPKNREESERAYRASYLIVRYIYDRYGSVKIVEIFKRMGKGESALNAVKSVTGADAETLRKRAFAK